jgi:hypothetical protein
LRKRQASARRNRLAGIVLRRHLVQRGDLLARRMRSLGVTMSVSRMPNLSLTTTTSPWAIRKPLTSTSIGSPARVSSSTTEPCASCRMCLIGMRVRPSSTVSCTGMSRIMLMSLPDGPCTEIGEVGERPGRAPLLWRARPGSTSVAGLLSASAAAHSAAIASVRRPCGVFFS